MPIQIPRTLGAALKFLASLETLKRAGFKNIYPAYVSENAPAVYVVSTDETGVQEYAEKVANTTCGLFSGDRIGKALARYNEKDGFYKDVPYVQPVYRERGPYKEWGIMDQLETIPSTYEFPYPLSVGEEFSMILSSIVIDPGKRRDGNAHYLHQFEPEIARDADNCVKQILARRGGELFTEYSPDADCRFFDGTHPQNLPPDSGHDDNSCFTKDIFYELFTILYHSSTGDPDQLLIPRKFKQPVPTIEEIFNFTEGISECHGEVKEFFPWDEGFGLNPDCKQPDSIESINIDEAIRYLWGNIRENLASVNMTNDSFPDSSIVDNGIQNDTEGIDFDDITKNYTSSTTINPNGTSTTVYTSENTITGQVSTQTVTTTSPQQLGNTTYTISKSTLEFIDAENNATEVTSTTRTYTMVQDENTTVTTSFTVFDNDSRDAVANQTISVRKDNDTIEDTTTSISFSTTGTKKRVSTTTSPAPKNEVSRAPNTPFMLVPYLAMAVVVGANSQKESFSRRAQDSVQDKAPPSR